MHRSKMCVGGSERAPLPKRSLATNASGSRPSAKRKSRRKPIKRLPSPAFLVETSKIDEANNKTSGDLRNAAQRLDAYASTLPL
jgi:hypothetical protein